MRAFTRKRLLRVATDVTTLSRVRAIVSDLLGQHEQISLALKNRDISSLSRSIRASQKTVESLRFILRMQGKS